MNARLLLSSVILAVLAGSAYLLFRQPDVAGTALPDNPDAIDRGRYLVHAGGCTGCHADDEHPGALSGGKALASDFGTFYAPNITPDPVTGIGGWGGREFLLSLRHGRRPDGGFYFPAFPYRAYAGLNDQDVLDIGAYLMAQPAVVNRVPGHVTVFWLASWMMAGWNLLADCLQSPPPEETDPVIARGAYLARHLGHCGECHTPRNALGIPDPEREFAGTVMGGEVIEAIDTAALSHWTVEDIQALLFLGIKPDGDFVGGEMNRVIEQNTSRLTDADRAALAAFLKRRSVNRQ